MSRIFGSLLVALAAALLLTACLGPDDPEKRLEESCARQVKEVEDGEEDEGTPVAESTQERLEQVELRECARQQETDPEDNAAAAVEEGSGTEEGDTGGGSEADAPVAGDEPATEMLSGEGRELFTESCASCHVLADADASGEIGPNLDETDMDQDEIREQIEQGGGGMPPGLLDGEDADIVAEYIEQAAAQG